MSFAKRMWIAFGAILLLTGCLGVGFIVSSRLVDKKAVSLATDSLPGVYVLGELQTSVTHQAELMLSHINSNSASEMEGIEADIGKLDSSIRTTIRDYEANNVGAEEKPMCDKLVPDLDRLMGAWNKVRVPSRATQNDAAMKLYQSEAIPAAEALRHDLKDEYLWNKKNADQTVINLLSSAANATKLGWILSLVIFATGTGLATHLTKDTSRKLKQAIAALSEGSAQIRAATEQVAQGSQSLAESATKQAASLEETSASGNEINAMTRQASDNSAATAALMTRVEGRISDANRKLNALSSGMQEISASSDQISKVIQVINDIAFQTNILALNAAVEAARAGEAGMGFAVVAEEVRALAQRCAQATKDVSHVIEQSVSSSRNGEARLHEVIDVIADVTRSTGEAKSLSDQLQGACSDQARGMDQISHALTRLESLTQQIAASSEESASASTELDSQAQAIGGIVESLEILVSGRK